jgi:hypothetical protein
MSITSNYYRVTPQIMLEHRTDFLKINSDVISANQPETYYTYEGLDGNMYYTENPHYVSTDSNYFQCQSHYQKYPLSDHSQYYAPEWNVNTGYPQYPIENYMNWKTTDMINYSTEITNPSSKIYYDSINIYFLRGFHMDNLDGIGIQIKVDGFKANTSENVRKVGDSIGYVTLLDIYIPKDVIEQKAKLLSTALYMNSKFYSRYMTIEYPSAYAIGKYDVEWLKDTTGTYQHPTLYTLEEDGTYTDYVINQNASAIIEFETVSEGNQTIVEKKLNAVDTEVYELTMDSVDSSPVFGAVNTDYFNVRIYEEDDGSVVYYPVYGDNESSQEIDWTVMYDIESGLIPVSTNGFYDMATTDSDLNDIDFGADSMYYNNDSNDRPTKWKIYEDLNVGYVYGTDYANPSVYEENFSRIIDYGEQSQNSPVAFWRSRFIPNTDVLNKLYPYTICIRLTCRLVNLMRGIEAIRVATINTTPKNDNIKNYLNVNTYKIINKIQQPAQNYIQQSDVVKEKYIRSYYNATNLVAKNIGTGSNIYTQGQMTLSLYRTNNNYLIQLFNINTDNIRIPYDLTGPYTYKMVFPTSDGGKLEIKPNSDSTHQNLGIGTLVFYITGDQAKQIMSVSSANRYFSVTTDTTNNSSQETVLYEGKVAWIS